METRVAIVDRDADVRPVVECVPVHDPGNVDAAGRELLPPQATRLDGAIFQMVVGDGICRRRQREVVPRRPERVVRDRQRRRVRRVRADRDTSRRVRVERRLQRPERRSEIRADLNLVGVGRRARDERERLAVQGNRIAGRRIVREGDGPTGRHTRIAVEAGHLVVRNADTLRRVQADPVRGPGRSDDDVISDDHVRHPLDRDHAVLVRGVGGPEALERIPSHGNAGRGHVRPAIQPVAHDEAADAEAGRGDGNGPDHRPHSPVDRAGVADDGNVLGGRLGADFVRRGDVNGVLAIVDHVVGNGPAMDRVEANAVVMPDIADIVVRHDHIRRGWVGRQRPRVLAARDPVGALRVRRRLPDAIDAVARNVPPAGREGRDPVRVDVVDVVPDDREVADELGQDTRVAEIRDGDALDVEAADVAGGTGSIGAEAAVFVGGVTVVRSRDRPAVPPYIRSRNSNTLFSIIIGRKSNSCPIRKNNRTSSTNSKIPSRLKVIIMTKKKFAGGTPRNRRIPTSPRIAYCSCSTRSI